MKAVIFHKGIGVQELDGKKAVIKAKLQRENRVVHVRTSRIDHVKEFFEDLRRDSEPIRLAIFIDCSEKEIESAIRMFPSSNAWCYILREDMSTEMKSGNERVFSLHTWNTEAFDRFFDS